MSFSNITVVYDDIYFVDALVGLLTLLDGVSVTKVNANSFDVETIVDGEPDVILVESDNQKQVQQFIVKKLSKIEIVTPIFFVVSDSRVYGDGNETKFDIFRKPIYFPTFLKSIKREVREFVGKRNKEVIIGKDRAELIMSGSAIIQTLLRIWPTERMRVADRGLREGILYSLMTADNVLDGGSHS